MTCAVDFRSSGAPVFQMKDGVAQVVSVIPAKAEVQGKRVSLGLALEIPLSNPMAELRLAEAGHGAGGHAQILSGGLLGGAKIIKPTATDTQ